MTRLHTSTLIAASLALAFAATAVMAQGIPAKPASKPTANPTAKAVAKPATKAEVKPASKTLSGQAGGGKLMSRDELRACMTRLDDVNRAAKDVQAQRQQLDREREELTASGEALKAERADVDRLLAGMRAWEQRMRQLGVDIESHNKRSAEAQEAPRNRQGELMEALKVEQERLSKTRDALAAEEAQVVLAYQDAAKAFNARAVARDGRVGDWNQRNRNSVDASVQQQEARALWLNECANRPYLEGDEIAIKAGK